MKILLTFVMLTFLSTSIYAQKENTNHDKAYRKSLRKLKRKKDTKKQKEILIEAMNGIIANRSKEKEELLASEDIAKRAKAIKVIEKIQTKIEKTYPFTEDTFKEGYVDLEKEKRALTKEIASSYYERGITRLVTALSEEDKGLAKESYCDFTDSKKYGNQEIFLDSLTEKSFEYAHIVYLIKDGASFHTYSSDIEDELEDLAKKDLDFKKIYFGSTTIWEAPDCEIEITFKDLEIDLKEDTDEKEFDKEVVVGTETVENEDGEEEEVDQKEEVEGTVILKEITKTVKWEVDIDVRSVTSNCDKSSTSFEETLTSEIEEISISGDERAIPSKYLKKRNKDELKSDEEMAEELLEKLSDEVSDYID